MFASISSMILAQESRCPTADSTNHRLADYLSCPAFNVPLFALRVIAVAFLVLALFKAVAALGGNKISQMAGWLLAGALGVVVGFNPQIIANLVEVFGNIISQIAGMFS